MIDSHAAEEHHEGSVKTYLMIFGALVIFTLVSFLVNSRVRAGAMSTESGFAIILGVAIVKALLVALIFMHLKWDWGRLYFIIIPVVVLGTMMVIVLLPDIVLAWHHAVK
ncbi:MAG TPA: cytochrome C oxidase subunit IV family protein [Gemmataceae bacterium]|nr:cytochrome C oxidase subunit IV family protein [Gemmataceae bacterium]